MDDLEEKRGSAGRDRFRVLGGALFLVVLRTWLAARVPILGDEAYYLYWGAHPAGGYWDQPPMIGWWEAPFVRFSVNPLWVRLPNVLGLIGTTLALWRWMRTAVEPRRASLVAWCYFLHPLVFVPVLATPDQPLVLFSFLSAALFFRASLPSILLAGSLFGAAFLSKYYAAFLIPAFLAWSWIRTAGRAGRVARLLREWALFGLGALPFLVQHLLWNSENSWVTLHVQLAIRPVADLRPLPEVLGLFAVYLLLWVNPPFVGDLFRSRRDQGGDSPELRRFSLLLWAIPVGLFAVTTLLGRAQGLHWYASYLPFFLAWISFRLRDDELARRARQLRLLTAALLVAACAVLLAPGLLVPREVERRRPFDYRLSTAGRAAIVDRLVRELEARPGSVLLTDSFSLGSALWVALRERGIDQEVGLWGAYSHEGRQLERVTPPSRWAGRPALFVHRKPPSRDAWRYFAAAEEVAVDPPGEPAGGNGRWWIVRAEGFDLGRYGAEVQSEVVRRFYRPGCAPP